MGKIFRNVFLLIISIIFIPLTGGCGGGNAQKTMPNMKFGNMSVSTQIGRDDVVVLDSVEGSSKMTSIAFGLVNIIDGDKYQIFGIKLFKDRYAYLDSNYTGYVGVTERAYYKALNGIPDADFVFEKSMDYETSGVPLIWENQAVTFHGKAVKLKSDI